MKARNTLKISLLAGLFLLTTSTTCGAKLLPGSSKPAPSPAVSAPEAPELVAADNKVSKAKDQWETAKKQLEAARALVRAAEADYKAAKAAREALALQLKADGLAEDSGLKQLAARAQSEPAVTTGGGAANTTAGTNASAAASITRLTTAPAPSADQQPAQTDSTHVQMPTDFAADQSQQSAGDAPQLR